MSQSEVRTEHHSQPFEVLHRIGIALAAERDRDRLVETILLEAKRLCNADGGTLYLVEEQRLRFAMVHSETLGLAQGGTTGTPVEQAPIELYHGARQPNRTNVAARAYHDGLPKRVANAGTSGEYDFSGAQAFDRHHGYCTTSLLAIPLVTSGGAVLGVLQLINARAPECDTPVPFSQEQERVVMALAAQAGLALDNQLLIESQKQLLDAFIVLLAEAIDSKSPYTGRHCERVPVLTEMLVRSLCETDSGPFAKFELSSEEWRELRVAAWLHDCGKITTPVHVMDKATKLEGISDQIEGVSERFKTLRQAAESDYWKAQVLGVAETEAAQRRAATFEQLEDDERFLRKVNIGGEFLSPADQQRIVQVGALRLPGGDDAQTLLRPHEVESLCISRGTLSQQERVTINGHMAHTVKMLERLPFPKELSRVPEYACGHHEKMDGSGYPRGLYAGDMSTVARALAVADVFEALTASDRPYKTGKSLSESLRIMAFMKRDNHLDPLLVDHFVRSGVYRQYAERFLTAEQCDTADEAAVLAAKPVPFKLPAAEVRKQRAKRFLPQYEALVSSGAPVEAPPSSFSGATAPAE